MHVNFFDFGSHKGQEIDEFLKIIPKISSYTIYGFEANPSLFLELKKKFAKDNNIHIYNFAIASVDGVVDLYLNKNQVGSSIYKDKNNVTSKSIPVPSLRFSQWLKLYLIDLNVHNQINILKANIEGAELDLFRDMDHNDLFKYFHIFLSTEGGYTTDLRKIKSLTNSITELEDILKKHNVEPYVFSYLSNKKNNDNLREILEKCIMSF
jgi:FkbM family methyltransferase